MQSLKETSKRINAMVKVANTAAELVEAQKAVAHAKRAYYERLSGFNNDSYPHEERLDPRNPGCAEIIEHSKAEFAAYKAAKRKAYNAQRRLHTACKNWSEVA